MLRRRVSRPAALLLILLSGKAFSDGALPGWNTLVYLMYKLEVANYCSLTTERAGRGFQIKQRQLIEQFKFDRKAVENAQSESWNLAYREWNNRGLGGFKRWCLNDAVRYTRDLENIFIQQQQFPNN